MVEEGWLFEILPSGTTALTASSSTSSSSSSSGNTGEPVSTLSRVSSFMNNEAIPSTNLISSASESNLNMYTQFDPLTAPSAAIGKSTRRFQIGYGKSDGVIVAYLPPEKNEGFALWHMEHDDGEEEDLEAEQVEKAIRHYNSGERRIRMTL